ncbi:3-oxoacyl-[acyl-carrier-protein] synthase II, chloroplastic-like [Pyrus x bretschneideri]|uniref:3-oxoacyl-[acyl-carrier-protein] synthase II, chloroplastic-like n=1 Tax=Pyrus x bretschneideri TaxID=225117 RepID=UPI002030A4C8|nr:3-oxoacyl-[acyl-carrier-protein] synthase II, chloroplastic-like [Pyrus x bretschneideri]
MAADFGWMVPNYSTSTACATSSFRTLNSANHFIKANANHGGLVMGDGAGVLPLEELEHAKDHIVCKVVGAKSVGTFWAGVILCIEKALEQSGVSREDVNYINAHATSAPAGDLKEYNALIHCFGQNPELRVNSTKPMIGHLLGACGAVEAVAALQAGRTGVGTHALLKTRVPLQ